MEQRHNTGDNKLQVANSYFPIFVLGHVMWYNYSPPTNSITFVYNSCSIYPKYHFVSIIIQEPFKWTDVLHLLHGRRICFCLTWNVQLVLLYFYQTILRVDLISKT